MISMTPPFINPLEDLSRTNKIAGDCVMVIFGATGDLTARKLFPALYNMALEGQLPANFACVAFARRDKTDEMFRQEMFEAVSKFSRIKPIDMTVWKIFSERVFYHQSAFDYDVGYETLSSFLLEIDHKFGTKGNRVFYLSTQPSFFPLIIEKLNRHHLTYNIYSVKDRWSRVIIEKPFGYDLDSSIALQRHISHFLDESQIYRIDHFLGKETVQNLMVFRFSNSIFEALWNNHHIDHIQITVSEEIGIETRGNFFEESGMLRDIIQNHMMQLVSLVAMEPPINLKSTAIHNEKMKVMEAIRPFLVNKIDETVIRGQYGRGVVNGVNVPAYREENNVSGKSLIETYVALELYIDNWRWMGVPFYLRAGKRLPKRSSEIAIIFKDAPEFLFPLKGKKNEPNVLVIRIQPDEGISLKMNCKVPGLNSSIQPVQMDFRYGSYFGLTPPEAYERLICDCMVGDGTLFARVDELIASWSLFTPVLKHWQKDPMLGLPSYQSGSWGPFAADELLARSGRHWRLI